ncbi:MAG: hypothetical protein ABI687_04335 [Flavitalea sp.]
MQIKFIKNIQFTRVVKAEGRMREFNFRKPNGREQALCTVDVSDDRGQRIVFNMDKTDNSWKIVQKNLPPWIVAMETQLDEMIEEELRNAG